MGEIYVQAVISFPGHQDDGAVRLQELLAKAGASLTGSMSLTKRQLKRNSQKVNRKVQLENERRNRERKAKLSCQKKKTFGSKQDAQVWADIFGRGKPHRPYRCPVCGDWHNSTKNATPLPGYQKEAAT